MQVASADQPRFVNISEPHVTGSRAFSVVLNLWVTAIADLALELQARSLLGITNDVRAVDTFLGHRSEQIATHGVGAQAAGPAHPQAQTRQTNGHVGLSAGGAFVKHFSLFQRARSVSDQQHHGFPKGNNVQCRVHGISRFVYFIRGST